jgi:hypothetical protein
MAVAAVTIAAGAGLAGLAGPAHAAQSTLPITCDNGEHLTVRVNTNNSSEHGGWGSGRSSSAVPVRPTPGPDRDQRLTRRQCR